MIWIYTLINLLIGITIGIVTMRYKYKNLLNNQKKINNELQHNKMKLDEYKNELHHHFTYSITLLNKMADNYHHLYQNIKKSANFFLPNTHIQDDVYPHNKNKNNTKLPIEAPRDYSDNIEHHIK